MTLPRQAHGALSCRRLAWKSSCTASRLQLLQWVMQEHRFWKLDLFPVGHVFEHSGGPKAPQSCYRPVLGRPQPASELYLATLWAHF